jgi:hypothetical protein
MKFVTFKRDVIMNDQGFLRDIRVEPGEVNDRSTFVCTDAFWAQNQDKMIPFNVTGGEVPTEFSWHKLRTHPVQPVHIVVINGLGTGIGDSLCGSVALEAFHIKCRAYGKQPVIDFVLREGRVLKYAEIFRHNPYIRGIFPAIMPMSEFMKAHYVLNTEQMVGSHDFDSTHMMDWFFPRMGLQAKDYHKNLNVYAEPSEMQAARELSERLRDERPGERFLLVNVFATVLRSMPEYKWYELFENLTREWIVGVVGTEGNEAPMRAFLGMLPPHIRNRMIDLCSAADGLHRLIGMIQHFPDAVLTVDTSIAHLCGALQKQCLVMFSSIEPDLRLRYYPTVHGYVIPEFRDSVYWGLHFTTHDCRKDHEWNEMWERVNIREITDLTWSLFGNGDRWMEV